MLVLELLGTLSLRDDAGVVPPAAQQKRRLGLLAILALGRRQGLSRNRIESYLWPESTAARARHALDQAVYGIRHTLGGDVILSTGQDLRLNPDLVRVDTWELEAAIAANRWEVAVSFYKGPLLDGFHFGDSRELEAWIDTERVRVLLEYQTAIEMLADRAATAGDRAQEVVWRRKLARSDPLSAGPTKKLMIALADAGDRSGAVKEARRYQDLVRQQLEMEPDSGIERLVTALSQAPRAETSVTNREPSRAEIAVINSQPSPAGIAVTDSQPSRAPHRARSSMERSRFAALAFFAIIPVLLIGVLAVKNGQATDPRSAAAARAATPAVRAPLPAARDAYLRGLNAWDDRTSAGLDEAIGHFRRATELDPGYAAAHAHLAMAYVRLGYFGYRPAEAMFPKARAAAQRSIELDSMLASPHTALATALAWEHDFVRAEGEHRKAISLDPADPVAHQWYGVMLMMIGRVRDAVIETGRAAQLAPLDLQAQNNYATFLNASGDHPAALSQFEKTIGEEPDSAWVRRNPWVLENMARTYADNGRYRDAVRMLHRALEIVPRHPRALRTMAAIHHRMGRSDLARQAFARADASNEQYAAYRGLVYADQGKADSAFLWFERQEKWGIQPVLSLQADRRLDYLRNDPRFARLMTRIRIPIPLELDRD
ncbi:MAG TPA: tetratricopeptide repeat protein [Gemmatimonadaceae bacterium]|nr:tetratricopeptide repeat protein [Gemmatimonadaceae bacterium]